MQVAEILADITSLKACGHEEALALVNVHKSTAPPDDSPIQLNKRDQDLHRAKELVNLHYEVKKRYQDGEVDEELRRAREDVDQVIWDLS
ncbi:hypothetical protein N7495_003089 [Penicillium taxi]|uniref:uncharacterized protein n=1 Tax=Penicillium taxi TaxID=168475 RepID=UPI0025458213|nr:uncharacterized protein N7495_003089 [Penicillium taxi]KAJ5902561.1 hypothetical protein N7495_003089 [Penicillium taxi]